MIETVKLGGRLKWHHIGVPTEEDFEYLLNTFHFHPLDIDDCRQINQRPKIDVYDDYYFLILHFPNFDSQNRFIKPKEIKIFWGEDYIFSIGKSHWVIDKLFKEAQEQENKNEDFEVATSDSLFYTLLERLMTESIFIMRKMGLELDLLNRELFNIHPERIIERMSITRKNIIVLNTMFKPQLRVFNKFESGGIKGYADNMEDYWGNILDYYNKIWDMTEDYAELIEGLTVTFDSMQTNKTNEIMKILTLISSIILPLTFVTSLYGMNVFLPLQENIFAFWILLGIMLLTSILLIFYFRKKKWM